MNHTIRLVTEEDRPLLNEWISKEPTHTHDADFYLEPGTKSLLYLDEVGPVFVIKYSSVLRTDIDFNLDVGRDRIRAMFQEEFPPVEQQAKDQGFRQMIFESASPSLIGFFKKLGFFASPNEFIKTF